MARNMHKRRATHSLSPPSQRRRRVATPIYDIPCGNIQTCNGSDCLVIGTEGLITKIVGDGLTLETNGIIFKTNDEHVGLTELMNKIRTLEQHQVNMRNQVDHLYGELENLSQISHQLKEENMTLKEQLEMIKSWMELNKPSC